jgi:Fur family ferric uptake transcriptional regulator
LRGAGRRAGGARDAVISVLARHDCAVSAQEASELLTEEGREVGIASVYRALETLHSFGLVRRLELGDGVARFEPVLPSGAHHHHALCEICGEVTPFDDEQLEAAMSSVETALPHQVSSHEVVVHGTCATCTKPSSA